MSVGSAAGVRRSGRVAAHRRRPRALICLNDRIAMGVYQALAEHGLTVPGDVAVISFDGSDMATWLRPRVTSLGLPFRAMGTLAVEILMSSGRGRHRHLPAAADAAAGRVGVTFTIDGQFVWDFWTAHDEARGGTTCSTCTRPPSLGTPSSDTATRASGTRCPATCEVDPPPDPCRTCPGRRYSTTSRPGRAAPFKARTPGGCSPPGSPGPTTGGCSASARPRRTTSRLDARRGWCSRPTRALPAQQRELGRGGLA